MEHEFKSILLLATIAFICGACFISAYLIHKSQRSWKSILKLLASLALSVSFIWIIYSYTKMNNYINQMNEWTNYPSLSESESDPEAALTPWDQVQRYSSYIEYGILTFISALLLYTFALLAFATTLAAERKRHEELISLNEALQEKLKE